MTKYKEYKSIFKLYNTTWIHFMGIMLEIASGYVGYESIIKTKVLLFDTLLLVCLLLLFVFPLVMLMVYENMLILSPSWIGQLPFSLRQQVKYRMLEIAKIYLIPIIIALLCLPFSFFENLKIMIMILSGTLFMPCAVYLYYINLPKNSWIIVMVVILLVIVCFDSLFHFWYHHVFIFFIISIFICLF